MLIFTMVVMYGIVPSVPIVNAVDNIYNAKDTISDSDKGATNVTHTFEFTLSGTTTVGGVWRITFPDGASDFGGIQGSLSHCSGLTASTTSDFVVECIAGAQVNAASSTKVVLTGTTNPNPSSETATTYTINIERYDAEVRLGGTLQERIDLKVAILDDVLVTARVTSTLTFTVKGTTTAANINGDADCDVNTTTSTIPYGDISVDTNYTACQDLFVQTNASDGYIVTVEQSDELTNDGGDNINSFNNSLDDTGSTTPVAWANPKALLDQKHTYGHFGFTTNDQDLQSLGGSIYDYYGGGTALYAGFNGTDPAVIMHHDGPTLSTYLNTGRVSVAYRLRISALQEAGDYETTLTYICTPTY